MLVVESILREAVWVVVVSVESRRGWGECRPAAGLAVLLPRGALESPPEEDLVLGPGLPSSSEEVGC